jgi:hypothetical protein
MTDITFEDNLQSYSQWREQLIEAIGKYHDWRQRYGLSDVKSNNTLLSVIQDLMADRITLAFVAEFSRGKTELINALFFSETGLRLLPSTPGRTTMCPTELFCDNDQSSYIRLLDINSRVDDAPINELKQNLELWTQIELDCTSPKQMQTAFKELLAVKKVPISEAISLGLYNESDAVKWNVDNTDGVEIPRWRHALISYPHPLFKKGLTILDTPGLNALGSEPELTINMLPSAQAIVFVIAADTGVTKSDLDIWCNHTMKTSKQGLAVVLNKIDTMWGDALTSEEDYQEALDNQLKTAAAVLNLDANYIFPVSAKQALIAKIQNDPNLLQRSGLTAVEAYLSQDILQQRRKILMEIILREIGFLIKESINLTEINYSRVSKQHQELKQLDIENRDMIMQLILDTQNQQKVYDDNYAVFKKCQHDFNNQVKELILSLSRQKIDPLIKSSRQQLTSSISTYGMKQGMRKLFNDFKQSLEDSVALTTATRALVKDIHYQFHHKYGFQDIEPELFSITDYQQELERLFAEFDAFCSSTQVTLTEQSLVVKKLYSTLIFEARKVFANAYKDAAAWSRNIMNPLMYQMLGYKKQIESRLAILKSLMKSKENLNENLAMLEKELDVISRQRDELNNIVRIFDVDSAQYVNSLNH